MLLTDCSPSQPRKLVLALMSALILIQSPIRLDACYLTEQETPVRTSPVVNDMTYKRVLDILFADDDTEPSKTFLIIRLRFAPNSQPESQVIIRRGVRKHQLVEYTSASGNIYQKLNEKLALGEREDPTELAKQFEVIKRTIDVPIARIEQWHSGCWSAVAKSAAVFQKRAATFDRTGEEVLPVHGAFYEVWYKQGLNTMSFNLYDVEVDRSGSESEFKLVRWMNSIRHTDQSTPIPRSRAQQTRKSRE